MKSASPTLEGFRVILRHPRFGLAEIAWRWSFAAACWLGLAFGFAEYLKTLPITNGDLLLLRTRQPSLIFEAIAHIFQGSGFRVLAGLLVLTSCLALGWIVLASFSRAATIKALLNYFRQDEIADALGPSHVPFYSIVGLNFLRVAVTFAATLGCLGALLFAGAISPAKSAPGSRFLIFLSGVFLVWLVWLVLNWLLSLAAVFVVREDQRTLTALVSAVALCRRRTFSVLAAGIWFGLAHIAAFVLATSVVAFPIGLAGLLPAGIVLGAVLCVTLLYFAVVDFFYMGRLAAYVAILELPESGNRELAPPVIPRTTQVVGGLSDSVDPDELILGDLPSPA